MPETIAYCMKSLPRQPTPSPAGLPMSPELTPLRPTPWLSTYHAFSWGTRSSPRLPRPCSRPHALQFSHLSSLIITNTPHGGRRLLEGVTGCGAQKASLGGIHWNRLLGPLATVLHFAQARLHTLHSVVCLLAHVLSPLQTGISTKIGRCLSCSLVL